MKSMRTASARKVLSALFVGACALSVILALIPLAFVLFFVLSQGIQSLNLDFFRNNPRPVGEPGGGMANAIVGTLILTGLAAAMAVPIGILSGVYLSEYRGSRFASAVRFAADTLNGVPTEELLLLVPNALREGALALGATRARAVFSVIVPAALPGIITGVVLALARIAGETAPLLFTSFNNAFFSTSLTQPISSITVQVFTYAISPYEDWHRQAWAGALVLVTIVLICSMAARIATARVARIRGQ